VFFVLVGGMAASQQPTVFKTGNVVDAAFDVFFVGVESQETIPKK